MASVRKRKWTHEGIKKEAWVVAYTDQGGKRRLKTFDKKKDADRYRTQVETEIEAGVHVAFNETVTVAAAADALLRDIDRRSKIKDVTIAYYDNSRGVVSRHILPEFGRYRLSEIKPEQVQQWIDRISLEYSAHSVRNIYKTLRLIMAFGVRRRWLKVHILREIPCKLPQTQRRAQVPTRDDLHNLLNALSEIVTGDRILININRKLMALLGLFGGFRPGEACGLHWEDIDLVKKRISLCRSYTVKDGLSTPKTDAGIRGVPLTPPIHAALIEVARYRLAQTLSKKFNYKGQHIRTEIRRTRRMYETYNLVPDMSKLRGFVILSEDGKPVANAFRHSNWRPVMVRAGLWDHENDRPRFTQHALRHAAVSLWSDMGMPLMNLQRLIGHKSIKTTLDVYGHLFPEDTRTSDVVNAVATAMNATMARQELVSA